MISEAVTGNVMEIDGRIWNLLQVQNAVIGVADDHVQQYEEYNETLHTISSQSSFWDTDETEYKIETEENPVPALSGKRAGGYPSIRMKNGTNIWKSCFMRRFQRFR